MIIIVIGGIGSGKSLSVVKEIVEGDSYPVTNFRLKGLKYHRLKYSDLISTNERKEGKKIKTKKEVNWQFWDKFRKQHQPFSIYLDEAHNLVNARASMTKQNVILTQWVTQIRKVLSDSEQSHLWIVSQHPDFIDKSFKLLSQIVIECDKIEAGDKIYIVRKYYNTFRSYEQGRRPTCKEVFLANPYFKYYDTLEKVYFKDADDYI